MEYPGENRRVLPTSSTGAIKGKFKRFFGAFGLRPDSEHEQALIRLGITIVAFLYVYLVARADGAINAVESRALWIGAGYLAFSAGMFSHIMLRRGVSIPRRIMGMIGDLGVGSYAMYFGGELCAPLYVVLLWVTFGNGFRYGRKYLLAATILSTTLFLAVIQTNRYWRSNPNMAYGLLIGLVVLPAYVSSLLKKMEEAVRRAEEANRAKNRFLANMSHEMRTPLNGILGMVDLLRDTTLSPEQKEFTGTVRASAATLLSLVEDVLDFSKIEAGKVSVGSSDFDLHALMKSTSAMLAPQIQEKGLRFTTQVRSDVPFLLRGDPLLIRQVILNLLGNAVKFTDAGEVCLRVARTAESLGSVALKFEVTDTGIGIAPEAQERIFNRFTQADNSITRRFGGTGLGTTIAKELVELMGGTIGLESEPGKGSTFWFAIELEKQPAAQSPVQGTGGIRDSRVLIVSSDAAATDTLRDCLASWGIAPVVVKTGAGAFAPLVSAANGKDPFDVAIVVERGLDMDVAELATALKSVHLIQAVQLVLAAGGDRETDLESLTQNGYGAVVRVPIDKTMLFNALHFVQPDETADRGIASLASRYQQKLEGTKRIRVLVAEDNVINQKVVARMLERAGHAVQIVENGEKALDALERDTFDLVLMDLQMPVMGGLEAAKIHRLAHPREPRVPIVALTADATSEAAKECREAGMDACLTKPLETKKLLEVIASLVPAARRPAGGLPASLEPAAPVDGTERGREIRPALDPATIDELKALGGSGDFFGKLVAIFLEAGAQKIREMEMAAAGRRYGQFRDIAHAMKGSAGQVGALPLMEICNEFSRIGPANHEEDAAALLERLKEEFDRVADALRESVGKPGSAVS